MLAVAAGVVFYMLLALFPVLAALVSLYGLFTDPNLINANLYSPRDVAGEHHRHHPATSHPIVGNE